MKKALMMIVMIIFCVGGIFAQKETVSQDVAGLGKREYDEVLDRTTYKNSHFTHYSNMCGVSLVIVQDHETKSFTPFLLTTYSGKDWIFFEKIYLYYDGTRYSIEIDGLDRKDDINIMSEEDCMERIAPRANKSMINFLRDYVNGENVKVSLRGDGTKTWDLTMHERSGLKEMLKIYDKLLELGYTHR